ncbi:hypothetical protein AKJ08_0936 [Vulgatibacter incomptus]|uniref:Uncharacterized protein n=1 Tax=Vulgatibacter incomptus TaxID=1391653 RepID=A0A0K1PBQ0_9BACT|nr:hypothetical protein AKJ08_0936 [Vulgatibacter incomptus]
MTEDDHPGQPPTREAGSRLHGSTPAGRSLASPGSQEEPWRVTTRGEEMDAEALATRTRT